MLDLFRRHSAACLKTAALQKLSKKKQRVYPSCDCGCYFSGTWAGKTYPRTSLRCNDWREAQRLMESKMAATTLADRLAPGAAIDITLGEALERWRETAELAGRAQQTLKKHKFIREQLIAVAGKETPLARVDGEVVNKLRLGWVRDGIRNSTHRTYLCYLGSFFNFARKRPRKWIIESPVPETSEWPAKIDIDREETMPLDPEGGDANYQKVLAALKAGRDKQPRGRKPLPMRGHLDSLIALCKLMYESGPRISDAIMFRLADVKVDSEVATWTYLPVKTKRTGKKCTTFIPLWLWEELRQLPLLSPGYPFFDGSSIEQTYFAIHKEMVMAGDTCGVPGVRPHRFRDSFAVNLLNRDVPISAVSGYLGHKSVRTTEEYYSPWVKSRADNARRKYLEAQRTPEPSSNVVPFPRKQA
jgi:integrase/recombinase XerD